MSLPIHVGAYSGYKPNERQRHFTLDEVVYEIAAVQRTTASWNCCEV